jgi:hypothetical protein
VPRHDLDLTALVTGLVFVAFGLVFVIDGAGWADVDLRWIAPVLLVALGAAGLAAALRADDT